jgi:hypothetical protein
MSLVQEEPVARRAGADPRPPIVSAPGRTLSPRRAAIRRAVREIALVALLFLAYKVGRLAADGHVDQAFVWAHDVWHLERLLNLPNELALQQSVIGHEWLIKAANCYYAYVHFPATAVCLIWLYLWRPERYVHTRRLLAWLTAAALVVHLLMPLAPPRMLAEVGIVDTGRLFGPAVYGSPATDTLTNQYAAMPSLHVGWALAIAIALIGATGRSRWRWLWLAHPVITLLVVVITGNHYWLDAVVVTALLGVVWAIQNAVQTARPEAEAHLPRPRTGR